MTVDAPNEPVMLGEKITATIKAKYYFGSPVTEAKVKYKVLRTDHNERLVSAGPWDWFYGPGYWWFAYDYDWYPGWQRLGLLPAAPLVVAAPATRRPRWWPRARSRSARTARSRSRSTRPLAKAIHGDKDHRYKITAEVVDESRRTIVGKGTVLVARKPFKVYAWVDRGYYRVGDVVHGELHRPHARRQAGRGQGQARRSIEISYDATASRSRTAVQHVGARHRRRGQGRACRSRHRKPGSTGCPTS